MFPARSILPPGVGFIPVATGPWMSVPGASLDGPKSNQVISPCAICTNLAVPWSSPQPERGNSFTKTNWVAYPLRKAERVNFPPPGMGPRPKGSLVGWN
jgi:hypothetical protein